MASFDIVKFVMLVYLLTLFNDAENHDSIVKDYVKLLKFDQVKLKAKLTPNVLTTPFSDLNQQFISTCFIMRSLWIIEACNTRYEKQK